MRATSDTGLSQQLALVESVLASIYFISVLMFCRDTRPSLTNPELFRRQTVAADVETSGELTSGMLVIDRRQVREWKPNLEMLVSCDVAAVKDCILRGLASSADAT